MFRKFAVLLLGACGVQRAAGFTGTISIDSTGLAATSSISDVISALSMTGAVASTTKVHFLVIECDGDVNLLSTCTASSATELESCSPTYTFATDASTSEELYAVATDDTTPTAVNDGSNQDYSAYLNDLLQTTHKTAKVCRTTDDASTPVASWTANCNCATPTLSVDSPSATDTLTQLLAKIKFSSSVTNSDTSRVFIVDNHYGTSAVAGCGDSSATDKLLIATNDISASPTCDTTETEETLADTNKGCSLTSLKTDVTDFKPTAAAGPTNQITLYYSLDKDSRLSGTDAGVIVATLKKSEDGPFTQKVVLCVTESSAEVSTTGSCACPFSVSMDTTGLSASSAKTDIYTAITASGDTTNQKIYIVDHWAEGCLKTDKRRLLAAIDFSSGCSDSITLSSGGITSACEKIEWVAPTTTTGEYHRISIYASTTDLPSAVSATARDETGLQSFDLGVAGSTHCYLEGAWSDNCVCISAETTDTNAANIFANVLVKGATKLVFIDEDAGSGSNPGGCAVTPAPAGKVLAYVTNIAKTNPSPACATGVTSVTFKEQYKGCYAVDYQHPTVNAGESLHQLKLYGFTETPATVPDSSNRSSGNAIATAVEALTEDQSVVVCAAEGTIPLPLSAATQGACTCPAATTPTTTTTTTTTAASNSDTTTTTTTTAASNSDTTTAASNSDTTTTAASNSALKSINTYMVAFISLMLTAGVSSFV